jgi:ribosomal protein L7/L12
MKTWIFYTALVLLGFLIGRFTAPKERTSVVYKPTVPRRGGGSEPGEIGEVDAEIAAAIRSGRKIQAIKMYRETYGTDLKSAKEAVEALQARLGE